LHQPQREGRSFGVGLFLFYFSKTIRITHSAKENSMVGTVKFWNTERQFGFAVTEDGQEFYITAGRFTRPAARSGQLHWVNLEGKRIRFDRAMKSPDAWTRRLNDGKLRDADGIDSRNPRPPRRPQEKPVATNVVVIEEKS
jgi:cold shock CspA family protein